MICAKCKWLKTCNYVTEDTNECECYAVEPQEQTNFDRITASAEALAEFIDQVTTECYCCGRNRMSIECQKEPCSTEVRYCTKDFVEWLKQESTE